MGHLRLTTGYLKATVVHIMVTLGHLRVTIFFISKHKTNKVRKTCYIYSWRQRVSKIMLPTVSSILYGMAGTGVKVCVK